MKNQIKKIIKSQLEKLPHIKDIVAELNFFKAQSYYPPGHYYSTIPLLKNIESEQNRIWKNDFESTIEGIDLHSVEQVKLVKKFSEYYSELPFKTDQTEVTRYKYDNSSYSFTDAIILYSFIRHFKPKRIIEIGSGHSSAVMLDTNELFFNSSIKLTMIEPYPKRLNTLLRDSDNTNNTIIVDKVQNVDLNNFKSLNAGDILFVDSSHVVKTGSDVNHILFDILPNLKKGVYIHFHDIFYPFEYPKEWVLSGRHWNENYFLKAFLMYNPSFKIKFFSDYMHRYYSDVFSDMPLTYKNTGGNLWLEKIN